MLLAVESCECAGDREPEVVEEKEAVGELGVWGIGDEKDDAAVLANSCCGC